MLKELLNSELVRDWRFVDFMANGASGETLAVLSEFWGRPEFTELAAEIGLPHDNRGDTLDCIDGLLRGEVRGTRAIWLRIAEDSEEVAEVDPVAASLISFYPVAAWEGQEGRFLYKQQWTGKKRQISPDWGTCALAAARNLVRADAFWTARGLARAAIGAIYNTAGGRVEQQAPYVADYRKILDHCDRRYEACVTDLAWELREGCRTGQPNFRAEVGALFWSLGDVPHAQLLKDTGRLPTVSAVTDLVRRSMQVMHFDPAVQEIWLRMKDRAPFSLREHQELFPTVNLYWPDIPVSLAPGQTAAQHFSDRFNLTGDPPSNAYAAAVIEHFGTGVSGETRRRLEQAHMMHGDTLQYQAPEAVHRMRSLLTLVMDSPPPGSNALSQSERWVLLARDSRRITALREGNLRDSYDRRLDIPFYYLQRDSREDLDLAISLAESYREGGHLSWRYAVPPLNGSPDKEAAELRAKEDLLIAEFRAHRYLTLLPFLPPAATYFDEVLQGESGSRRPEAHDVDTTNLPELVRYARKRVAELAAEIGDTARQISEIDPEYRASRILRTTTVDEFVARLLPGADAGS